MEFSNPLGIEYRVVGDMEHLGQPARSVRGSRTFQTDSDDLWDALTNAEREQQGDNQYSARARNTAADINSVTADDVEQEDHVNQCDSERSELPARHRCDDDDDDVTVGEYVCSPSKDNCTSAIL